MTINSWPKYERPREKLLQYGAHHLSNAELIAILLQCGTQGYTALDLARQLLNKFGSLHQLREAPLAAVLTTAGIGNAKYALLRAALELGRRSISEHVSIGTIINSSTDSKSFLLPLMQGETREIFACLFLNARNQILAFEKLFFGTLSETAIYPREIVKQALHHNAAKLILCHNHPSGHPEPSPKDHHTTMMIQQALNLVDIKVIDHIIIGTHASFSFADEDLL